MATEAVVPRDAASSRVWIVLTLAGMLAYPALRVAGSDSARIGASLLMGSLAYLLAIFLYYGVSRLALSRRYVWLAAGAVSGAIIGVVVGGIDNIWLALANWAVILATGIVTGRMLDTARPPFRTFVISLVVLTVLTIVAWYPTWQQVYRVGETVGKEMVADVEDEIASGNYSQEQARELRDAYAALIKLSVRLTPASTIVSGIVQYSLGFIWLTWMITVHDPKRGLVRRFIFWKVPFALTPVLAVMILARLLGNDEIKLVADNGLLVLSIFYSVCGLSLMEYILYRVGVSTFIRVLFYVLLVLTQVAGLLVMVLVGFIDSFVDWRKIGAPQVTNIEHE